MAPDRTRTSLGYAVRHITGAALTVRFIPGVRVELVHSGKVRDLYADGDDIIMVASDRVSVYDVVLPTPIPGKGVVLTQLSLWWFEQLTDVIANHVISGSDVPAQCAGRAVRGRSWHASLAGFPSYRPPLPCRPTPVPVDNSRTPATIPPWR